jgi:hypothetical protein
VYDAAFQDQPPPRLKGYYQSMTLQNCSFAFNHYNQPYNILVVPPLFSIYV